MAEISKRVSKRRKRDIWKYLAEHPDYPEPVKDPEEKEPQSESDEHESGQINLAGNLAKGTHRYDFGEGKPKSATYYAWNAWNYIGSGQDSSRDIYGDASPECFQFYNDKYKPNFYQIYPCKKIADTAEKRSDLERELEELKQVAVTARDMDQRGAISYLGALKFRAITQFEMEEAGTLRKKKKKGQTVGDPKKASQKVGCAFPYRWQAHHIIAMNFFTEYLSSREYRLVRTSTYDINHGSNIIFLPERERDRHWHKLPDHLGSHPKYDTKVQQLFERISEKLEKAAEKPHPGAVDKLLDTLLKTQDVAFKFIVKNLGPTGSVS